MSMDPTDGVSVGAVLQPWLEDQLGRSVQFVEPPTPFGNGFDTWVLSFRVAPAGSNLEPLPSAWDRPLVLRIMPAVTVEGRADREAAIQRFFFERGYPVPEPLATAQADSPFGHQVMVMERSPGGPMLDALLRRPHQAAKLLDLLGSLHARLHRIDPAGWPVPVEGTLVSRRLVELEERARPHPDQETVVAALGWLRDHAGVVSDEEQAVLHNDFHPLNVLVEHASGYEATVIDWTDAGLGDRHHDASRTVALFWVGSIAADSAAARGALRVSRGWLARRYRSAYEQQLPLDDRRLAYWEALHLFHGWLQVTELHAGDLDGRTRDDGVDRVPVGLADALIGRFRERTAALT